VRARRAASRSESERARTGGERRLSMSAGASGPRSGAHARKRSPGSSSPTSVRRERQSGARAPRGSVRHERVERGRDEPCLQLEPDRAIQRSSTSPRSRTARSTCDEAEAEASGCEKLSSPARSSQRRRDAELVAMLDTAHEVGTTGGGTAIVTETRREGQREREGTRLVTKRRSRRRP